MSHRRNHVLGVVLAILLVSAALTLPANAGSSVTGTHWFSIGPAPAPGLFPGGAGGRATAIAVNPMNQDDVWIGTAGGGVWHFNTVTSAWVAMSDNEASLAIGSIALAGCDSTKCTSIYAGTGENASRRDTYYGAGLLVGTFDGTSVQWVLRNGAPTYNFAHGSIYNVVLDPTTSGAGQVIFITLSSGVTASASESTVTAPPPFGGYGIYKSTDNGITWARVFGALPLGPGLLATDLEMDPSDHNTLYAGILGSGIWKSTAGGGPSSWCPLDPGITRPSGCSATAGTGLPSPTMTAFDHVEVAIDPTKTQHLYASFGMCPDRFDADCSPQFLESTNGGSTWTTLYPGDTTAVVVNYIPPCPYGYSRYTHALTVDPSNPSNFFVGAVHLCKYNRSTSFFDLTDHDNSPATEYAYQPDYIHLDHHAVVFAAADATHQRVYDANDGGIAKSTDGGNTWTPMVKGLAALEFQSIAMAPTGSDLIPGTASVFGGLQDNGSLLWKGAQQWELRRGVADGGFSILTSNNLGTRLYSTTNPLYYSSPDITPRRALYNENPMPEPDSVYDIGLPSTEPRSFYPPYIGDPLQKQYFGTQRLFTSNDFATNWSPVSPFLVNNSPLEGAFPGSGTFPDVDSITAITFHPSKLSHLYLGTYTGKIFRTTAPCTLAGCWFTPTTPPPASPITRLAVDPTVKFSDTVWASLSGFFDSKTTPTGTHVYGSTDGGVTWTQAAGHPDLNGVPVNTIAIDPGGTVHNNLWIGTDKGVYRSDNGGLSWYRFSFGLPNVPVYELLIDGPRDRVIAATHGRGAYILSPLTIKFHSANIKGSGFLSASVGSGFGASQRCVLRVLRQDGSICASGGNDALGGGVGTDVNGFLESSRLGFYSNLPLVSFCAQGRCLGTDIKNCNVPGNPMATLEVTCGSQVVTTSLAVPPDGPNPPSSEFTLSGLLGGTLTPAASSGSVQEAQGAVPEAGTLAPTGGSLQLMPSVQAMDGSTRILCNVGVPFVAADSTSLVLQRAGDAVNMDPSCQTNGVAADFVPPFLPSGGEDQFPRPASLRLRSTGVMGGELVPGLMVAPGQGSGLCLNFSNLEESAASKLHSMRVRLLTLAGGALGGSLTLSERTGLGSCSITAQIPAGSQPTDIAQLLASSFQASGIPGPNPGCPSDVNPRDVVARGDSLITALASEINLCLNDGGVGVTLVPQEVCFSDADCDDSNPCTLDTCDPATGQCHSTPVPDGQPCDDNNLCTIGNICQSGVCGTPVVCNDGNPCTADTCDPATGACTSQPLACDDGNPCTTDSCDPSTGQCVFTPTPGAVCNDGNLCTIGDVCVTLSGSNVPVCQGQPKCAGSDPCTTDLCDPATGTCSSQPVQCDDGNPCTLDSCQNGACVYTPVAGIACDDGDPCTTGDQCVPRTVGNPICIGTPVNCDDGDACTLDSCEPTTGGCRHIPIGLAQVPTGLQFTGATTLTWPSVDGASFYNTYRGTIPMRLLGSRLAAGPLYDQACFEFDDANGDGAQISTDAASPPLGTAFYYLVSEETSCGESAIGSDFNGTPIPNTSPCSNPAPPALAIVKSHSGSFTQGQQGATYLVAVSNAGAGPTFGTVTVTDNVPSGLTLDSMAGPGWICPSPGNTCTRSDTLGPGAGYPPIVVTVDVAATASSPQVNVATVSGGGSPAASSSDSTVIIPLAPQLSITKTHSGNFYRGQTNATYTVTVSNPGNAPTSGTVTVSDTVPVGLSIVSMSGTGWTCPAPGSTCTRSDALAAGSSYPDITITVNVAPDAPLPTLTNQVTASGGGSASASANDPTQIDYPLLAIVKSHVGNFVQGQQGAVYTLSVQNQGFGPTVGTVMVTEVPPSGLSLVSMSGTGWTCSVPTCTRGDSLASAASYPDITVTVNVVSNAPSSVTNEATASGGASNGTGTAFNTTQIDPAAPVLAITKTHTGNFTQGQTNATYTVTVSNTGNAPTSGTITVTETVPSGLTLVSMSGTGWTCPSPGNTCSRSDALAAGASYPPIKVTVNVSPNASSPQVNQVSVSQPGIPPATASDSTGIDPPRPAWAITKTHNANFSQGQTNATYQVTVSNTGPLPTTTEPVHMMEMPPPGLMVVSMAGTGWTCDTVQCIRADSLAPGASYPVITITVSVAPDATSPLVNQVTVQGGGAPPAMASDSTTIIPAGVPSLSITKTHTGNFTQGQTNATYTVRVSNNTGAGATVGPINVMEMPPSGLVLVSMGGIGWSCAAPNCTRGPSLAPGATTTPIIVTVNVLRNATSPQVNQVTVSGGGSAPASASDPTVIVVP